MLRIILAEIKDISLVKSSYGFRVNHSGNADLSSAFFCKIDFYSLINISMTSRIAKGPSEGMLELAFTRPESLSKLMSLSPCFSICVWKGNITHSVFSTVSDT